MSDLRVALRASTTFIDGIDAWPWPLAQTPATAPGDEASACVTAARDADASTLALEGGEPLREPGWRRLVRLARDAGLEVELATGGRLLGYPRVADAVAGAGLARVLVPLFAATPALHDALVRVPGAHAQVLAGLAQLRGHPRSPALVVRTWLDTRTLAELPALVTLATRLGALRLDVRLTAARGHRPTPDAARAALADLDRRAATARLPWTLTDVPLCWAGAQALEPFLASPAPDLVAGEHPGRLVEPPCPAAHVDACAWCAVAEACPGLPEGVEPTDAHPLALPIPNCFELEALAELPPGPSTCARERWAGPLDPHRHVLYQHDERAWLLEARGAFFPRRRLVETRQRGLLYVNVSGRARLDDFREQLRRLRPAPACGGCERPCPGAFEHAPEPVLQREEAEVVRVLEALEGDVLDVGFGPNYHRALFERLHDAGRLRYAGVEPDPLAFAALAAERPDLAWQNAPLEQLEAGTRRFDAVLLLRSWNHLAALPVAVTRLQGLLKPGGRLVVVDNVRFGYHLPAGALPEEGGRYEHYRNHDLAEAELVLAAAGFRAVQRTPIRPGGDNQWMLVVEWPVS